MPVTLSDLAQAAGVSTAAVSMVLAGKPNRVSAAKREQIAQLARQMGYRPRGKAARPAPRTLALLLPDVCNAFFAELAAGAEQLAAEADWNTVLALTHGDIAADLAQLSRARSWGVGAAVLVPSALASAEHAPRYRQAFGALKAPVVLADRTMLALDCTSVMVNHQKGGYLAAQHLLALGHRHIGLITGPGGAAGPRTVGARQACREAGEGVRASLYLGDYTLEAGYRLAPAVLSAGCTAVFCANDLMACGFARRCKALGARIPQDVSLVGYDGIFFADLLGVPLTTVQQPAAEVGRQAAAQALGARQSPGGPTRSILLDPVLQVRSSTAAPAPTQQESEMIL